MIATRPYRLWSDERLEQARSKVEAAVTDWAQLWSAESGPCAISGRRFSADDFEPNTDGAWRIGVGQSGGWVAMRNDDAGREFIECMLSGSAVPGRGKPPIVSALIDKCSHDLRARLLPAEPASWSDSPARIREIMSEAFRPGAGAVKFTITQESRGFELVMDGEGVAHLAGKAMTPLFKGGLVDRRDAIQAEKVRLSVEAGGADISLGDLSTLRSGDVLVLDTRFDELFRIATTKGVSLGSCYLGFVDGRKAVQLRQ